MRKTVIDKMIELGYVDKEARSLIMAGKVFVNTNKVANASEKIDVDDQIVVKGTKEYVSRGAYKLLGAIDMFSLDLKGKVVLDIGSSTGGFTQVALINGAKKVYALDSGTNQLDYSLRRNPNVVAMEKTNLKDIKKEMFDEKIDFVVCDVSFISLKHVFKVLSENFVEISLMALIKPQFEANSNQVQDGGFVPEELHDEIIRKVTIFASENNFKLVAIHKSPIEGNVSKNIEYISLWNGGKNE